MTTKKQAGNTELINFRFYENQKRQALTDTELVTVVEGDVADLSLVADFKRDGTATCNSKLNLQAEGSSLTPTNWQEGAGNCKFDDTVGVEHNTQVFTSETSASDADHSTTETTTTGTRSSRSSTTVTAQVSTPASSSTPSDKSRKGSVDQRICNLVNLINAQKDTFFTTSSCSGRIILYTWDDVKGHSENTNTSSSNTGMKKGCKWLLVTHDEVHKEELENALQQVDVGNGIDEVYFKMEPCILHVQCRTLTDAKKLVHVATESGFRNSGMVIGKENRITVAIRSAMGLEVPFPAKSIHSSFFVNSSYLEYLGEAANAKMRENWTRSEKLTKLFANTFKG